MIFGINHLTLSVNDLDESFHFYVDILGCKPIQKNPNSAYVLAGDTWVALDKSQRPQASPGTDYSHIAFSVEMAVFSEIKKRLLDYGVTDWQKNKTEGESFYFLDPNGHKLELATSNLNNRIEEAKMNWGDQIIWYT